MKRPIMLTDRRIIQLRTAALIVEPLHKHPLVIFRGYGKSIAVWMFGRCVYIRGWIG